MCLTKCQNGLRLGEINTTHTYSREVYSDKNMVDSILSLIKVLNFK